MEISKGIGSCIKNVYEKNRINFKIYATKYRK